MTTTGQQYSISPTDMAEARAEGRLPRRNLIRDSGEPVRLLGEPAEPVVSGYGPRPRLAEKLRRFVRELERR